MTDFERLAAETLAMARVKESLVRLRQFVEHHFALHGTFAPMGIVLSSVDPDGKPAEMEVLVPVPVMLMGHPDQKDVYAAMLRTVAKLMKAEGVLFASEAWIRRRDVQPGEDPQEVLKQAEKEAAGGLAGQEGAVEAIVVTAQTLMMHQTLIAEIDRSGPKPTLRKWDESDWLEIGQVRGPMADLLPTAGHNQA